MAYEKEFRQVLRFDYNILTILNVRVDKNKFTLRRVDNNLIKMKKRLMPEVNLSFEFKHIIVFKIELKSTNLVKRLSGGGLVNRRR